MRRALAIALAAVLLASPAEAGDASNVKLYMLAIEALNDIPSSPGYAERDRERARRAKTNKLDLSSPLFCPDCPVGNMGKMDPSRTGQTAAEVLGDVVDLWNNPEAHGITREQLNRAVDAILELDKPPGIIRKREAAARERAERIKNSSGLATPAKLSCMTCPPGAFKGPGE